MAMRTGDGQGMYAFCSFFFQVGGLSVGIVIRFVSTVSVLSVLSNLIDVMMGHVSLHKRWNSAEEAEALRSTNLGILRMFRDSRQEKFSINDDFSLRVVATDTDTG
jgi:hypothetical protein